MTSDDFASIINPLARHGLTASAGLLAAHGMTGAANTVASFAAAGLAGTIALCWSFAEKNSTVAAVVAAAPISELEGVASVIQQFKAGGANPLVVVHLAQVLTALATSELPVLAEAIVGSPSTDHPAPAVESPPAPPAAVVGTTGPGSNGDLANAEYQRFLNSFTPGNVMLSGAPTTATFSQATTGPFQAAETHGDMA